MENVDWLQHEFNEYVILFVNVLITKFLSRDFVFFIVPLQFVNPGYWLRHCPKHGLKMYAFQLIKALDRVSPRIHFSKRDK